MSPTAELFTCQEAAEYLHVPVRFIRRLIAERPPLTQVRRYVRLKRSDLDAFVEAGRVAVVE